MLIRFQLHAFVGGFRSMSFAHRRSFSALFRSRPVATAMLATLVMLTTTVGDTHAQSSAPAAPTGLASTSVAHDSVTLRWDDPGDTSITGYEVLRRDTVNQAPGTFTTIEENTGSSATAYTDSTVEAETRYVYRVKAINASGTSGQSNYFNVETPAAPTLSVPAQPIGLAATSVSHDSVTLTWDDPGDSSITGYQVLRRSRDGDVYGDGQGDAAFVAVIDDTGSAVTTYTDTSVTAHTRYVYRVKAINSEGMGERSSYLNVETPTSPTPSVPAAPTGLAGSSATHDSITLTWDDPGDSSITGYQVLRRSRDGDDYGDNLGGAKFTVVVDDTGSSSTTYSDMSVEASTRYAYSVKARNAEGLSEPSEAVNAETSEAPADTPQSQVQGSRPNVVLILADDLGWGDLETNNPDSAMTTPNIDSVAAAGVHFTDAHTPSSVCSPTRYGLLTGRYAWRTWLTRGTLNFQDRPLIGPDRPTLGTLLQGHGYRTAAIGKWHLGMDFARLSEIDAVNEINRGIDFGAEILDGPIDHGFDEFFGTSSNLRWVPPVYIRNDRFLADPDTEDSQAPGFYEFEEVLDRLTEEAVSFVERSAQTSDPFFLYLPLPAPHVPLAPNAHFDGLTGLGPYADFVAQMDWTVGQVLDALDRTGAREDTLVIFTSDNGSFMNGLPVPNHADHQSNGMWKGSKKKIYEGGHRVPLLIQWPRTIEAGSTVDATVSLTDIYATLAGMLGEEPEPGVAIDSVSLLPLLSGEAATRGTPVVHHSYSGIFALRDGDWKLVFGYGHGGDESSLYTPSESVMPFSQPWQLFDMEQDPRESKNVAGDHPEVVAQMEATLAQIRAAEEGRLSDDATLKSLRLAGLDLGSFTPNVLTYAATVSQEVKTVRVSAHPTDTDARVNIATPDGRRLYQRYFYGRYPHGQANIELSDSVTTIKVTVTSPDRSATAEYTVTVERALDITGTPQVGQTLTAVTSGISKVYGLTDAMFSHQWLRSDRSTEAAIAGATGETYTLTTEDQGKTIRVRVSFIDDRGNAETQTSPATGAVGYAGAELTPAKDIETFPVISGYSEYGDLGTLSPDAWQIDGTHYTVKYLLQASESLVLGLDEQLPTDFTLHAGDAIYRGSESMVSPSAEGVGYWWPLATPDWFADEPMRIKLAIHRGVPLGERSPAPVTGYFRNHPPEHDGREDFTFRIHFSEAVTATAEALRDHVLSVSGGTVLSVDHIRGEGRIWDVSVTPDSRDAISILIEPDLGCEMSGAICAADGRRLFNRMELRVPMRPNNPAKGKPTISGTVEAGETLTADTSAIADGDGMTGAAFSYQWVSYDGTIETEIQGATDSTYTLVPADEGNAFRVRVLFTDDAGFDESLTSALARLERPYGLGASESDGAVVLTWKLPAGWSTSSMFQVLRNRPELGEDAPLVHVRFHHTAANVYRDTDVEPGVLYIYRVKGVDPFGYTGEASDPLEIRTEEATRDVPPAPFNLTSTANGDGSVTVRWNAPDDDSITGYQVLQRQPGEAEYSMVESVVYTGGTETTYTHLDPTQDVLHAYSVRAINTAGSSEPSNYDNAVPHRLVPLDFGLGAPTIYLTFDDGPREPDTPQMLDLLEKYGARATFFVVGSSAALHPDIIARMATARHGIGNHTWQHESLPSLSRENFESTVGRTQEQIGAYATRCLRPPNGDIDANTGAWAASMGLELMMWTFDSRDTFSSRVDRLVSRLSRARNGAVILLHEHRESTFEAVRIMLDRWARQGYQLKPVCAPPRVPVAPPDDPPEGAPTVSGPVQAGRVLTSDTSGITDGDGLSGASFSYQWFADNSVIAGETGSSYLIAPEHEGKTIKVQVSFTDDAGNMQQLTSVPTAAVAEAEKAAGSPWPPEDLSAVPTNSAGELLVTWNPPENRGGPAITGYEVEWKLSSSYWGSLSDIRRFRTTGTSHRITGLADASQYAIRTRAVSQDLEGAASEEVRAAPTGPAPLLAQFQDKSARHEGVRARFSVHIAFSEAIDYGYIEFRDGSLEVDGGIVLEASRVDRRPDLWRIVILPHSSGHVTITLPSGKDCSLWGAICTADGKKLSNRLETTIPGPATFKVEQVPLGNNPATGRLSISGTPEVGRTLTGSTSDIGDADGLANAMFSYQWMADGADIPGATGPTYIPVAGDAGKTITVRASFTDDEGNEESLTSEPTEAVAP